jgi:hypothetical protein
LQPAGIHGSLVVTSVSLGKVVHTADGGQIFGFDVDKRGSDALLSSIKTTSQGVDSSVEAFDQITAKITKVIASIRTANDDFVTWGIFGTDVGLVQRDHVVNNHNIRSYHLLNPVTGGVFNGVWTPPNLSKFQLQQIGVNQATQTAAVLGFVARQPNQVSLPVVFSSSIAANTFGRVFSLDPNTFGGGDQPQMAQDILRNQAVLATSPDGGAVGGQVPLIATVDLSTGRMRQFNGVKIPPLFSGYVNGLAVDPSSRTACTTTELDANVEFYNIATGTGFAVQLPGTQNQDQFQSGRAVINDPLHKLFLVVQPNGSVGPAGDAVIDVYDVKGNVVESITGFQGAGTAPQVAINPAKRTGFINGPTGDALTQFTY